MSKNIVEVLTRAAKGQSLTYEEMDANLLNLLQKVVEAASTFDPAKLSGTLDIDITGKSKGINGVLPIDQGGTGVTDPHSLLQVIGAYPVTNPQGYVRASDLPPPVTRPSDIGLGNVNNTADLDKPVSYPMQDALSFKEDKNKKNAAFGYVGLSNFDIVVPSFDGKVNSVFESQAISSRKYTLPDKNITIAGLEDITGINSGTNTGDETQASIMLKLGVTALSGSNTGDQTLESLGIPNVENKSPNQILAMLQASNVTNALGFIPFSAMQMAAWKGKALGLAELDKDGYLRAEQIPPTLNNSKMFQGLWDASTNSPQIATGFGVNGHYYKVSIAGSTNVDGETTWNVGDVIQYVVDHWVRIAADQSSVLSVNGKIGNLTLTASDISGFATSATVDTTNADNITSGHFNPMLMPGYDGDVTSNVGTTTLTLKNTTVQSGSYGKKDKVATFAVDGKGRLTAAGEVDIQVEWTSVLNRPNTLADFQITDAVSTSALGAVNGVATLGSDRLIPAAQLPAWAQDNLYVKSITGNTIIKVDSRTDRANPSISITQATSTTSGFLSSADWLAFNEKQPALGYTPINSNLIGVANGLATLDAGGKILYSQMPTEVLGGLTFKGFWDPVTNTPTITSGSGIAGWFYKVTRSGTRAIDNVTEWQAHDLIMFDGVEWGRLDGTATDITSVAGRVGNVVLTAADIGGLADSATTDTTNANNISAGILPSERLPAFSGDVSKAQGNEPLVLATVNASPGTYGSDTQFPSFAVDNKGRVTSVTLKDVSVSWANVVAKPTTIGGFGITDAQPKSTLLTSFAGVNPVKGVLSFDVNGNLFVDTSTYIAGNQDINITGDVSGSGTTSIVVTLKDTGVTAGTYGSETQNAVVAVNSKGLITGVTLVTTKVDYSNISNKPTTFGGYGITDVQPKSDDLTAIDALAGNLGLLRKTGLNTWALDTTTYLTSNQNITITGDANGNGTNSIALTLKDTGVTPGTYGSASKIPVIQVDSKGRITGILTQDTGTVSWSNISATPTTIAGYGITDAQPKNADLTGLAGLTSVGTTGYVKKTAAGVFTLDTAVSVAWANITTKPTSVSGYGITDAMVVGAAFTNLNISGSIQPNTTTGTTVGTNLSMASGDSASATAGTLSIRGGQSTNQQGGDVYLLGGQGGNGGGSIYLTAGQSLSTSQGGNAVLQGGLNNVAFGAGGHAVLKGGQSAGFPGNAYVIGGVATSTAVGGNVIIQGGAAGSSNNGGYIVFQTFTGGTIDERFRITSTGAWSLGSNGTNVGTSGKLLQSNGATGAPSWTNRPTVTGLLGVNGTIASTMIDLATADFFQKTITINTTFTLSNVPAAGNFFQFTLELTNGGSSVVTWWSGINWTSASSNVAPTLGTTGRDIISFYTTNGGTSWTGMYLGKALA